MASYTRSTTNPQPQCLALLGFDAKNLPIDEFSNSDITNMAGMAMSMPVVGTLLWAVVCQIDPQ